MNRRVSEGAGVGVARGGEGPGSIKHQASRTNGSTQEAKRGRTERPFTWWMCGRAEHTQRSGKTRDVRGGKIETNEERND